MNHDNMSDSIVVHHEEESRHISVLFSIGKGIFTNPTTYIKDSSSAFIEAVDINDDDIMEIIILGNQTIEMFFFMQKLNKTKERTQ